MAPKSKEDLLYELSVIIADHLEDSGARVPTYALEDAVRMLRPMK